MRKSSIFLIGSSVLYLGLNVFNIYFAIVNHAYLFSVTSFTYLVFGSLGTFYLHLRETKLEEFKRRWKEIVHE